MLHLKGLEVYITIYAEPVRVREAGVTAALLGCGFDDGKAAASRRTPKCPQQPRAGRIAVRCGGGICDPGMKKPAEQLPQLEKARTLTQKVRYQMTNSESRTFG